MSWTPQPIVPDLVEASGPHVRQQAAATRLGREGHGVPPMGPGVRIAPADLASVEGEQAGVGQGAALDRSAPVVEPCCRAWHRRLTRDDPGGGPARRGTVQLGARLVYPGPDPTAAHCRAGPARHEGRLARRPPRWVVSRAPPGWHPTGPVWLGGEGPGPGVPHTQHPAQAPHVRRGRGTREERLRRRAEQDVGDGVLGLADELPPLLGPGEDDRQGGDRQAFRTPCCPPGCGFGAVAWRTPSLAAGVGALGRLPAVVTRDQGPTEGVGPAVDPIGHRPPMPGPPRRPNAVPVVAASAPPDRRHLWHDRTPEGSAVGHEGGEGGMHARPGRRCEMGVAGRGPGALVAQPCLHDAPRPPACQQRGRLGVPPRRAGGLCGDATRAHPRCAGLVAGGGGPGGCAVPGWKHPGAGPRAPPARPPSRQPPRGERHAALLAPWALVSPHPHPLRVDGGDLPLGPVGPQQSTRLKHPQTPPGVRVLDQGQSRPALPPTQRDRQLWGVAGSHTVADGPRSLPRALGAEPAPLAVHTPGPLRDLLVGDQAAAVLAELRFPKLLRSAPIMVPQRPHGFEVTRWGPRGQAPEWPVFQQTASERGHRHPPVRGDHQGAEGSTRSRKINGRSA